jgi:hypothetical protein
VTGPQDRYQHRSHPDIQPDIHPDIHTDIHVGSNNERHIVTNPRRTPSRFRTVKAGALALVLASAATTGLVVASGANADTPTTPPWQTAAFADPNAVGTLSFYDASGAPVTGGSTTAPISYAVASGTVNTGDNEGTLFAYTPQVVSQGTGVVNNAPAGWSGEQLSAATAFPLATHPGSVSATLPAYAGSAGDVTLANYIAAYPNALSTSGYQNVYELRLRTTSTSASVTPSNKYAVADIVVTGSTWAVYGTGAVKTDTTTSATVPATGTYGTGFDVPVTVAGTGTPGGTVTLKDGSTTVGSAVTLASGAATIHVAATALAAGTHSLTVAYGGDTGDNSSTSDSHAITIAKGATTTAAPTYAKATYGTAYKATAKVTGTGFVPTGTATLRSGSTTIATATLSAGTATFTIPGTKLTPGSHSLTVAYAGSANAAASTSAAKTVAVGKAVGHLTNTLAPKKLKHTKRAKLTIKVTATGVVPTGTITIYDGTKKIGTASLTAAKKGTVVVTLPKLKKGSHKIHAVYAGSTLVGAATGASVTLKST